MTETTPAIAAEAKPERRPKLRFEFLDGLRGFSALYVVFFHFLGWKTEGYPRWLLRLVYPIHFGHTAVSVFIVLSGFSLMLGPASAGGRITEGFAAYIWRRARRILPPYYAAFALSILAIYFLKYPFPSTATDPNSWRNNVTPGAVLAHLFLIHNLDSGWAARINAIHWSVATEWQIYFIFPIVLLPVWRRMGNATMLVTAFLLGFLPPLFGFDRQLIAACPWYTGLFAIGMAGAAMVSRSRPATPAGSSENEHLATKHLDGRLMLTAALMAIPLLAGFHFKTPLDVDTATRAQIRTEYFACLLQDSAAGGLVLCLILYFARRITHPPAGLKPMALRALESPLARLLASFSYSLYLTHYIVYCILLREESLLHLSIGACFTLNGLVGIPLSIVLGYGFHLLFERPMQQSGRARKEEPTVTAKVILGERPVAVR